MNIWSKRLFHISSFLDGDDDNPTTGGGHGYGGWGGNDTSLPNAPSSEFDPETGLNISPTDPNNRSDDPDPISQNRIIQFPENYPNQYEDYYITLVGGGGDSGFVFPVSGKFRFKCGGGSGACWRGLVRLYKDQTYYLRAGDRTQESFISGGTGSNGIDIYAGAGESAPPKFGISNHQLAGGNIDIQNDGAVIKNRTDGLGRFIYQEKILGGNHGDWTYTLTSDTGWTEWLNNSKARGGGSVYGGGGTGGHVSGQSYMRGFSGSISMMNVSKLSSLGWAWDVDKEEFYTYRLNDEGQVERITYNDWWDKRFPPYIEEG